MHCRHLVSKVVSRHVISHYWWRWTLICLLEKCKQISDLHWVKTPTLHPIMVPCHKQTCTFGGSRVIHCNKYSPAGGRGRENSIIFSISICQACHPGSSSARSVCFRRMEFYQNVINLSTPVPTTGSPKAIPVLQDKQKNM